MDTEDLHFTFAREYIAILNKRLEKLVSKFYLLKTKMMLNITIYIIGKIIYLIKNNVIGIFN